MKKCFVLILTLIILVTVVGCSSQPSNSVPEKKQVKKEEVVVEQSFMEEYLRSIDADKREDFLVFNESTGGFCQRLESKLEEAGFEGEFEFNPSRKDEVPAELEAIYTFMPFSLFPGIYIFDDINMIVTNTSVKLSYEGYDFYPSEYSYTDIKDIIERVNAE